MNNTSAGPSSKAARVGAAQPLESSLKRKPRCFRNTIMQRMMYGFRDVINSTDTGLPKELAETVKLVEDIVVDYVTNMAHKAQDIATKRGKLLTEDFLFLIRKDSVKLNLCRELLTMHEDLKEARKAFEFDQEELAHKSEGEV